ncbi:siderophore-interacting protein [Granulicella sp. L60]|uniref:siderophore-interacting protein n=1 Tax=Granulicella sp. L60 TaxID=1641866 RepID=UPI00131B43E1|nr:hypothetical protein [Granulicella sp. L60]
MIPIPKFMSTAIERVIFRQVTVSKVRFLSERLQCLEITGESLKGAAWLPGQVVRFNVGNLTTRSYTPMRWDPIRGSAEFILFLHDRGPGSLWAAGLDEGDICNIRQLRNALDLTLIEDPVIFFGDETSFATAKALHDIASGNEPNTYIFEVSSIKESEPVLQFLGIPSINLIEKKADHGHLYDAFITIDLTARTMRNPCCVLTGQALSIQKIRQELRVQRFPIQLLKTKAHWSNGKAGMD